MTGANWSSEELGATHYSDTTRFFRGQSSFRITSNAFTTSTPVNASLTESSALPLAEWYARVFIYLPLGTFPRDARLMNHYSSSSSGLVSFGLSASRAIWLETNYASTRTLTSATTLPTDVWTCLELGFREAPAGALEVRVWVNGTEVNDLAFDGGLPATPLLDRFVLGALLTAPPGPTVELWYDELVIAPTRVTCAR